MVASTHANRTPTALTIAGSDSSGGAGIQADLKTFSAFGVYGASIITALTAQNTRGVTGVVATTPAFIGQQLDAVASDLMVAATKTGMLATREAVLAVCDGARRHSLTTLVVDPVMVATSGDVLLADEAIDAVRHALIPLATLITPNLAEAARLLDAPLATTPAAMAQQARDLVANFGARAVLIKGGHGSGDHAIDVLLTDSIAHELALPRLTVANTHGTGCTLSAAITALLVLGHPLEDAVRRAKRFVWLALQAGSTMHVGGGSGPVDHLFALRSHPLPS